MKATAKMMILMCLTATALFTASMCGPDEPEDEWVDPGGNGNGSGDDDIDVSGSNGVCNWTKTVPCVHVSWKRGPCGAESIEWTLTNTCSKSIKIAFRIEKTDGTWPAGASGEVKSGGTYSDWSCSPTGNYKVYSMYYSDFLANRCSTPEIDNKGGGGSGGSGGGSGGGGSTGSTGSITVYSKKDHQCGSITVTLESVGTKVLTKYFYLSTPDCGADGAATFSNLKYGTYTVNAKCATNTWSGTVKLAESCHLLGLN